MRKNILTILACITCMLGTAQVRTARIFADSMVLQRDKPIPVWGWAGKGESISVSFHDKTQSTVAGPDGKWRVTLAAEKAGGPYQIQVSGKTKQLIRDVYVGDVWICSGQSNMEFTVQNSQNKEAEIADARFPLIRHIKVPNDIGGTPKEDILENAWHSATPAFVGNFTAVGYFFARKLYQELNIPIGLVNSTWGGTDSETWTSREAMQQSTEFAKMMKDLPVLNLDSLSAIREKLMLDNLRKLQGNIATPATIPSWKETAFDDSQWPVMQLPGLWETQQLSDFDGTVWVRKTITLKAEDAGKAAELLLGMIDDNDIAYLNGVKIGSTNGYNIKRVYRIPAGLLKAGDNSISVRMEDTGGGGGLYGDAEDLQLVIGGVRQSLSGNWRFQVESVGKGNGIGPNSYPSLLYNAMIHPLIQMAIKGVIWYQGENNAGRAFQYRAAFPLLIKNWRNDFKQGDFPFYFVQLASFNAGNGNSRNGSNWAELREAQTLTLSLPHTGMAVTTDIGDAKDIHPKNKQDVGKRLAAVALHDAYQKQLVFGGPVFESMKIEGEKAVLSFTQTGSGLAVKGTEGLVNGFELAGEDHQFYESPAVIRDGKIIISSSIVSKPVAVRYAWSDDAGKANLFNKEGFPAQPFRTDNWKGITNAGTYKINIK